MKTLTCSCGKPILLDNDWGFVFQGRSLFCDDGKRVRYWDKKTKANTNITHLIMNVIGVENAIVDHVDFNPHNNQRANLRLATKSQNNVHQNLRKDNKTGYKGVNYNERMGKYTASICCNGKQEWLGTFPSADDAALAYNKRAKELFGEFAVLNKIQALTEFV